MEDRLHTVQMNSYPKARSLTDIGATGDKQSLDIAPGDCGAHRIGEDGFDGRVVLPGQGRMVSFLDIMSTVSRRPLGPVCSVPTSGDLGPDRGHGRRGMFAVSKNTATITGGDVMV
jgi:hypothetical protein